MFSYHETSGQSRARRCVIYRVAVPAGVAASRARAAAAHWLVGAAGRLDGLAGVVGDASAAPRTPGCRDQARR